MYFIKSQESFIRVRVEVTSGGFVVSGLLRESGGVAGQQQAPAGNHRHVCAGHTGKTLRGHFLCKVLAMQFAPCW